MSEQQKQDAALHDPFGYDPTQDMPTVTGNKGGQFDKQGFNRAMDRVLNP